jgi:hypothetical protein
MAIPETREDTVARLSTSQGRKVVCVPRGILSQNVGDARNLEKTMKQVLPAACILLVLVLASFAARPTPVLNATYYTSGLPVTSILAGPPGPYSYGCVSCGPPTVKLATLSLPSGYYLLNATVTFANGSGSIANVACWIEPQNNGEVASYAQIGPTGVGSLPLSATVNVLWYSDPKLAGPYVLDCDALGSGTLGVTGVMMTATPMGALVRQ